MKLGDVGDNVRTWQADLNEYNHRIEPGPAIDTDGIFGNETEHATQLFQLEQGLFVDGIAGPETQAAMNNWLKAGIGLAVAATGLAVAKSLEPDPEGLIKSRHLILELDPSIRPYAEQFIRAAYAAGIPIVITSGLRDMKEQQRLYAQGRTTPGAVVTNALPGSSWHNFGLAFDIAILKDGKATWPNDSNLWRKLGDIGKKHELIWGGDFETIKDQPHFERHPMLSLHDAR